MMRIYFAILGVWLKRGIVAFEACPYVCPSIFLYLTIQFLWNFGWGPDFLSTQRKSFLFEKKENGDAPSVAKTGLQNALKWVKMAFGLISWPIYSIFVKVGQKVQMITINKKEVLSAMERICFATLCVNFRVKKGRHWFSGMSVRQSIFL